MLKHLTCGFYQFKHLLLLLIFILFNTVVFSQAVISGRVVAADNTPLAGASVGIKGVSKGTTTDTEGRFSIAANKGSTIVVSYSGYRQQEILITNQTNLDIKLEVENKGMNEVVVVGYGTQRKSDVTGAVATVDKKRLENLPNTNFAQALQSSVPGISIDQNSGGAEGNNTTIRIRGRNSITAETSPLIVLDGVPYNGSISDINPSDIESINVLKDASSAAIYGSRGANGVIIITSKKGTRGKPTISYDGSFGTENIANLPRMLTPAEFYQYKTTREPGAITTSEQAVYDAKNFPDWVGLVTRQGSRMQHSLAVNGGGENSRYYVSATYLDVKGVAVNDEFKRLSTRINVETNIKPWLTLASNTQLSYNNRDGLPAIFGDYTGAYRLNPLTTAFNADGTPTIYPWPQDLFFPNPLEPTLANNNDATYKVITNNYINVDFPFIKGLSYRINTGVEFTTRDVQTYYGVNTRTGVQTKGSFSESASRNTSILIENILNYNRTFGKHTIAFIGLYSNQNSVVNASSLTATGFPNDVLTYYQANVAASVLPSASYSKETLISQMARVNYSYNSKYLLTLTARRDGFSGFGENNKFSFFPVAAIGWNIGDEKFLKDNKVITSLKLRASYGSNGNQAISAYRTLARLSTLSYVDGATTLPGYVPSTLATPNLKWETTVGANIGIDFSLFQGRIEGSIDGYSKQTHDLLLLRAISTVSGASSILQNIGKNANKGLELGVNSINLRQKDFSWSTNLSISFNRNKIKDLYGDGKSDTANNWFIGKPIDVNFGYVYGGVWQLNDDLSKSPQPGVKPGYAKTVDVNGDGKITPNGDRVIIGSRQPDFIWGLGNTLTYKAFSLYAFVQGVQGTSRQNSIYSDNVQNGVRNNTFSKNYWTPTNPTNDYYANVLGANPSGVGIYESDSYARLKDLSLSYDLPANVLSRLKVSRLKIYVSARNLVTITKWSGMDPELNSQEDIPLQKEYNVGVNIRL